MPRRRFEDFQRLLDIGRNILTIRLNRLVDEGMFAKVEYQQRSLPHEYRLTDKGREVYPILAAMAASGDRWLTGPQGTPLVLHHTAWATRCTPSSSAASAQSRSMFMRFKRSLALVSRDVRSRRSAPRRDIQWAAGDADKEE